MQHDTPSFGLALVRIVTGGILLVAGWQKLRSGVGGELVLSTREAFAASPEILRNVGDQVVLQHPSLFAKLIVWGEVLGGLAFFLGAFTRPAGLALAFMFTAFVLVGPDDARNLNLLLAVACFACAISRAGRSMGADVFLDGRFPSLFTWTRG